MTKQSFSWALIVFFELESRCRSNIQMKIFTIELSVWLYAPSPYFNDQSFSVSGVDILATNVADMIQFIPKWWHFRNIRLKLGSPKFENVEVSEFDPISYMYYLFCLLTRCFSGMLIDRSLATIIRVDRPINQFYDGNVEAT